MSAGKAKGKRPAFAAEPQADRLVAIVTALMGEVAVLRERLDTVERLLERDGAVTRAAIESFVPDDTAAAERDVWRAGYLERVLYIMQAEQAETAAGETAAQYAALVDALAKNDG